jgi:hypothetical protein
VVTVQPARGHTDNLWTLLPEHIAVVRIGTGCLEAFGARGPAYRIDIGDGYDLSLVYIVPDDV